MKEQKTDRATRIIFATVMVVVTLVGIGAVTVLAKLGNGETTKTISSFEDCAADGRPILETYPEQCVTADGRSFTKKY